jgi:hypothetical protein
LVAGAPDLAGRSTAGRSYVRYGVTAGVSLHKIRFIDVSLLLARA